MQPSAGDSRLVFGIAVVFVVGLLLLLSWAVHQRGAPPLASGSAPEFDMTTFDGQRITLADLKGKPVVVNFWASWCIPCRDEAPGLQRAWEQYHDRGLVVLGVDYVDTDADAKKFLAEFGQTYPNGADVGYSHFASLPHFRCAGDVFHRKRREIVAGD